MRFEPKSGCRSSRRRSTRCRRSRAGSPGASRCSRATALFAGNTRQPPVPVPNGPLRRRQAGARQRERRERADHRGAGQSHTQMLAGARGALGACTSACAARALARRSRARSRADARTGRSRRRGRSDARPGRRRARPCGCRRGVWRARSSRSGRGRRRPRLQLHGCSAEERRAAPNAPRRSPWCWRRARESRCGADLDDRTTTNPNRRARPGGDPRRDRDRRNDPARGRSRGLARERQHRPLRRDPRGRGGARRPARVGVAPRSRARGR